MKARNDLLIVDDEPQLRNMLQRLFIGEGYAVTTAETGTQAMQRLKGHAFHMVLCDVIPPDANGSELTTAIRWQQPDAERIGLTTLYARVKRYALWRFTASPCA